MAWSSPITWVDGQIPTASDFNQQFRDNLNELSLHAHAGGSGSGTAQLGPLDNATFSDAVAPAGAGGTLTRIYTTVGTFGWVSPSGSAYLAANSTHEHILSIIQSLPINGSSTGSGTNIQGHPVTRLNGTNSAITTSQTLAASLAIQTATIGGNGSRRVLVNAGVVTYESNNGSGTVRFYIDRDGTVVATSTAAYASGSTQAIPVRISATEILGSGSLTYTVNATLVSGNASLSCEIGETFLFVREVSYV